MISVKIHVLLTVAIFLPKSQSTISGCTAKISTDLGDLQPLLLKPGNNNGNDAFYLPINSNGDLQFKEDESITFACPGGTVVISGFSSEQDTAEGKCVSGSFNIGSKTAAINQVTCTFLPVHTARYTGKKCLNNHTEIEIGFKLKNRFIRHILLCFDEVLQTTLYSEFSLTTSIDGYQVGFARPNFIEDNFFDVTGRLERLYTRSVQRATINKLLGLPASNKKYIKDTSDLFLARGHLTARADFVYGSQQSLTFHYVNVAPQWQNFNGGNWATLEQDIRALAANRNNDLQVFTGTYGISTLPHEQTTEQIELYIFAENESRGIPVPRLFWKILYDPYTKEGVAFVGVNNPYLEKYENEIICEDICRELNWLHWNKSSIVDGISYCCHVNALRKTVKDIPNFEVVKLLGSTSSSRRRSYSSIYFCSVLVGINFLSIKI